MENIQQLALYGVLVSARIAPVFVGTSLSPLARIPMTIRVYLVLLLSLFIILTVAPSSLESLSIEGFIVAFFKELLLGIALAFGIQTLFAGLAFAGRMVDMQIGFGAAGIIDPMTKQSEALTGTILTSIAILLFFLTNTHHLLLELLVSSVGAVPIGTANIGNLPLSLFVTELGIQFLFGLMVVIPVAVGLLLVDTIIAFTSRTMPQMNVYFVTLPLKIFLGILILGYSIQFSAPAFSRLYENLSQYWLKVLGA